MIVKRIGESFPERYTVLGADGRELADIQYSSGTLDVRVPNEDGKLIYTADIGNPISGEFENSTIRKAQLNHAKAAIRAHYISSVEDPDEIVNYVRDVCRELDKIDLVIDSLKTTAKYDQYSRGLSYKDVTRDAMNCRRAKIDELREYLIGGSLYKPD